MLVTDKLRSYTSAFRRLRLICPHEQGTEEEQSGRELAPGGATTRAQDAMVEISTIRSALSQHRCRRPQYIQCSAQPRFSIHAAKALGPSNRAMAECRRSGPILASHGHHASVIRYRDKAQRAARGSTAGRGRCRSEPASWCRSGLSRREGH